MRILGCVLCSALLLSAACNDPNHSGVYVFSTDREVTMVQVVESGDGKVTGRIQSESINSKGEIIQKEASVDGAISGTQLVLRPSSPWIDSFQASGTIDAGTLTLTAKGGSVSAQRSSLEEFQRSAKALRASAAEQRRKLAEAKALAAEAKQEEQYKLEKINRGAFITEGASQIRTSIARFSKLLEQAPNFAGAAAANTAKISQMARTSSQLSDVARGQLGVTASQLEVKTNQIAIQRDQYAATLNQLAAQIVRGTAELKRVCEAPGMNQAAEPCTAVAALARDYEDVSGRARTRFSPQKAAIEAEQRKQQELLRAFDN